MIANSVVKAIKLPSDSNPCQAKRAAFDFQKILEFLGKNSLLLPTASFELFRTWGVLRSSNPFAELKQFES